MTCIVGLVDSEIEAVYIGSDSAECSTSGEYTICKHPKTFRLVFNAEYQDPESDYEKGSMIFGYAGEIRFGQILQHRFKLPPKSKTQDILDYLVNDFVSGLQECLDDARFLKEKSGRVRGEYMLIGYRDRLFSMQDSFDANEVSDDTHYLACGISEYALGSLYTTGLPEVKSLLSSKKRIEMALQASTNNTGMVRPPFHIISTAEQSGNAKLLDTGIEF